MFKWTVISTLNMPKQSEDQLSTIFEELNFLSLKRQQLTDRRNVLAMLIQFKKNNGRNEQRQYDQIEPYDCLLLTDLQQKPNIMWKTSRDDF